VGFCTLAIVHPEAKPEKGALFSLLFTHAFMLSFILPFLRLLHSFPKPPVYFSDTNGSENLCSILCSRFKFWETAENEEDSDNLILHLENINFHEQSSFLHIKRTEYLCSPVP
jgi:hypothetical protein